MTQLLWRGLLLILLVQLSSIIECKLWPPPPAFTAKAQTARYLIHYAQWGVVSAVSPEFSYMPFGTIQSFADGPMSNSTGIPYFYIATISDTFKNIAYNNSVSLAVSLAENDYCANKTLDPEEPLCSRVTLFGKMVKPDSAKEAQFAKTSLFTRHPAMKGWPGAHGWTFYKLDIMNISLIDFYGGSALIKPSEYFQAQP